MARSFINELPTEVLGTIFFEITEQSENHECGLLASVCCSWNDVVQNTPQLWSRITAIIKQQPPDVTRYRRFLEKANQAPLSINMRVEAKIYPLAIVRRDVQALYPLFIQHQWRSLSITGVSTLDPFQLLFQHILDNPQSCKLSSLRLVTNWGDSPAGPPPLVVKEVLVNTLSITDLAASFTILDPSDALLPRLRHLHGKHGSETEVLSIIRETPLLQTLRLSSIYSESVEKFHTKNDMVSNRGSETLCRLGDMTSLDLSCSRKVPENLLRQLDLPMIRTLKLRQLQCSIEIGDQQIQSLVANVIWMTRIRSLTLERIQMSENALIMAVRSLPVLTYLTLDSLGTVGCETMKALSEQATAKRGWLCPRLEEIMFNSCPQLERDDLKAFVETRVRGVSTAVTTGIIDPNLASPVRLQKVVWNGQDMIDSILGNG
ncbi:hypothetical protein FRB96_004002 [Tulasnella sp. 330]|nr:hypothetical protein FRB96_004002 [Tulasnella sp. 330]KAG8885137.1 hypothetical protein FRB98_002002 [Tulasnella sp. 332]